MKFMIIALGLGTALTSHAASYTCHSRQVLTCDEGVCALEDNVSTMFAINGRRAVLNTYSVSLKAAATVVQGRGAAPTAFILRAGGAIAGGTMEPQVAVGTIEKGGEFLALINGVQTAGKCDQK